MTVIVALCSMIVILLFSTLYLGYLWRWNRRNRVVVLNSQARQQFDTLQLVALGILGACAAVLIVRLIRDHASASDFLDP